jgi:hypothetical protein
MHVECVVFLSSLGPVRGGGSGERSWIFKATNQASDPNFMVDIEIRRSAARRPKAREIVEPLENWLSSLDPDEVIDQTAAGRAVPRYCQYLWMSVHALGRLCAADALGVLIAAARRVR